MRAKQQNIEWFEFVIEDLFEIKIGKNVDGNKVNKNSGRFAYITRKETNNGLDGFINQDFALMNEDYPVITIGNETAEPFVQAFPFFTGTKVNILIPKHNVSKFALMFIAQSMKMLKGKFSYSFTINSTRLRRQKILLPSKSNGKPDYKYMESYIISLQQEKVNRIENFYRKKLKNFNINDEISPLYEKEFGEFEIGKLFKLVQGKSKGLNHLVKSNDGINYLGATNLNNGVLCQVKEVQAQVQKGNCIAFIRNGEGSMGYSIYKHEDFIATSDISVGYNPNLNRHVGFVYNHRSR